MSELHGSGGTLHEANWSLSSISTWTGSDSVLEATFWVCWCGLTKPLEARPGGEA